MGLDVSVTIKKNTPTDQEAFIAGTDPSALCEKRQDCQVQEGGGKENKKIRKKTYADHTKTAGNPGSEAEEKRSRILRGGRFKIKKGLYA